MVYGIWIDEPLYLDARWPYYIGSTDDGRRRLSEHRSTYADAVGIRPESVRFGWFQTENTPIALWAEHLLIHNIKPVANRVLVGAGCKGRGTLRSGGKPTPFRILHPRIGDPVDTEARRAIRAKVVSYLSLTAPPTWVLDNLVAEL